MARTRVEYADNSDPRKKRTAEYLDFTPGEDFPLIVHLTIPAKQHVGPALQAIERAFEPLRRRLSDATIDRWRKALARAGSVLETSGLILKEGQTRRELAKKVERVFKDVARIDSCLCRHLDQADLGPAEEAVRKLFIAFVYVRDAVSGWANEKPDGRGTWGENAARKEPQGNALIIPAQGPSRTPPSSQSKPMRTRAGRLPKAESEAKRRGMLATLRQHPSLKDDPQKLSDMVGVSESTVRRWLEDEERKYRESRAANPYRDED